VDRDLEHVEDWLSQDGADSNKRDYTGRTPLHLACTSSTPEIVKCLVDHGARIIPRLVDGMTALHLAASRGSVEIVRILLEKSSANEEEEADKQDRKRKALGGEPKSSSTKSSRANADEMDTSESEESDEDEDIDMVDDAASADEAASVVTGSFVKVDKDEETSKADDALPLDDDESEPDFYDIDVVAWDSHCSPLHFAILGVHTEVVKLLCQEFAADFLKPVKIAENEHSSNRVAILTLVLALALPLREAAKMAETLMSVGATLSQAELDGITAFHRYVQLGNTKLIESLWENDQMGIKTAINHAAVGGMFWRPDVTTPLMSAIDKGDPIMVLRLLEAGANPEVDFGSWLKGAKLTIESALSTYEDNQKRFKNMTEQPLIIAIRSVQPTNAVELLKHGADPNTLTKGSHQVLTDKHTRHYNRGDSALDVVRGCMNKLRKYKGEMSIFTPPHRAGFTQSGYSRWNWPCSEAPRGPKGTDEFLAKFTKGTYQH
jgi:ankyrin repeat protein